MVSALTTSIMIDSPLIAIPSFHAIAEAHIADGQRKERNCDGYPNHILHNLLPWPRADLGLRCTRRSCLLALRSHHRNLSDRGLDSHQTADPQVSELVAQGHEKPHIERHSSSAEHSYRRDPNHFNRQWAVGF